MDGPSDFISRKSTLAEPGPVTAVSLAPRVHHSTLALREALVCNAYCKLIEEIFCETIMVQEQNVEYKEQ